MNKEAHPFQPYCVENWCRMVNENRQYCENFNLLKWAVFYFWLIVGRVNYVDIPSFHPYWKIQTKKKMKSALLKLQLDYHKCKVNQNNIKFLFNNGTTLQDIEKLIRTKQEEIRSFKITR